MLDSPRPTTRRPPVLELFAAAVLGLVWLAGPLPAGLCIAGDVRAYLNGTIPAALTHLDFDAGDMEVGVGQAAVGDWRGLGEAIVTGGQVYALSTAVDTPEYFQLVRGPHFRTSRFAWLPAGTTAAERIALDHPRRMAALWQELGTRHPRGVLFSGYARFERLQWLAISRPAIHGQSQRLHTTHYFTEPMQTVTDAWVYLVGVSAGQPLPAPQRDDERYARLFVRTPDGRVEPFAHALLLTAAPTDPLRPPAAAEITGLGRVASDSLLAGGTLGAYPFARIAICEPRRAPTGAHR